MKLMGHRGARHEFAENTLRSIEIALEAGVKAIEIDVRLTQDGELIVIHDATVDRTTDGKGPVVELTLAKLRALDAGEGERLPTLTEVLEAVRGKAELFVEIKAKDCEAPVAKAIAGLEMEAACWVKSFNHRWIKTLSAAYPKLRTGCLLYGLPADPVGLVRAAGGDLLSLSVDWVDVELVEACHAKGVTVCAWNCNDKEQLPRFEAMGLDWLGTDVPTALLH
jgi:glycerophosphoryl diester phosphodiesterase